VVARAVLEQADALPGAQAELPILDRDGQVGVGEHGPDVGGAVVGAFQVVLVPGLAVGRQLFHESLQVGPGAGIVILADEQRGAGVRQVQEAHPFLHSPGLQALGDGLGEGIQPFPVGGNLDSVFIPIHFNFFGHSSPGLSSYRKSTNVN
jgi:hypothetical protein